LRDRRGSTRSRSSADRDKSPPTIEVLTVGEASVSNGILSGGDSKRVWDVSPLSPEKQDRFNELSELILQSKDVNSGSLDGVFLELIDLVDDLPLRRFDEPEQGPLIEVPGTLARYWQWQ
jgi:hypothetical protein